MFKIRRVFDDTLSIDRQAITEVQKIIRDQFPDASETEEILSLPDKLKNPLKYRFRSILFVADNQHGNVKGFALVHHEPVLGFSFLDYLSVAPRLSSRGIGGALYQRIREEAIQLRSECLACECLPDDTRLCNDPKLMIQNRSRLRFYERFGAFPVVNTRYETPLQEGDDCPPYLVIDILTLKKPPSSTWTRQMVQAILERKYGHRCPPGYIRSVVDSFTDNPVMLRPPRYSKKEVHIPFIPVQSLDKRIALLTSRDHQIHHVRERGYVEAPVRIPAIEKEIMKLEIFDRHATRAHPESHITAVHDKKYVAYFKRMSENLKPGESVYPYVFPLRNTVRPPRELALRAGYYCMDTFTPLNRNAFMAARKAVDCTLTAADLLLAGYRMSYALVRPPGHHAERKVFGGFCYFNNAAIAANYLCRQGTVAVLDIDYHHGNGTQDIFYGRRNVLTISLHGHPNIAYPYFSGFEDERGDGKGTRYNINFPLDENVSARTYEDTLRKALEHIHAFNPSFIVLSLGLDTAKGDPTGSWNLTADNFYSNGLLIGSLKKPILVVQEGGYRIASIGKNARYFFSGLQKGMTTG